LPAPTPAVAPQTSGVWVVAHAGQGSPAAWSDAPALAVAAVQRALAAGESPQEAAIRGVELLEDDPRLNAGIGANLRADGQTIQTDAALMSWSPGAARALAFGAVAGLDGIQHPIRVAEAVAASPHTLLAGAGAQVFADTLGLARADLRTPAARAKLARALPQLFDPTSSWGRYDWRARWNFPTPAPTSVDAAVAGLDPALAGSTLPPSPGASTGEGPAGDTVGVVLRAADGAYVAALSTGGVTLALRGRVGDVPQLGAGLYAGPAGAVAATGAGEAITRARVAGRVYDRLAAGQPPRRAIAASLREVEAGADVGVIAVSEQGYAALATTQMAWAAAAGEAAPIVRADRQIALGVTP